MNESIPYEDDLEALKIHKTRITNNQFAVMVDFLTLNPELISRDFTTYPKEKYTQKWEELAALLNADFTGAKKDVQSWRKCWRDRKSHLKIKVDKRDACLAEGSDPSPFKLSDSEEKLLQLIKEYEQEPDNTKYIKYLRENKYPKFHLKTKNTLQDLSDPNVKQKIRDNVSQFLGMFNKKEGAKSTSQAVDNPISQQSILNNIPTTPLLPSNYLLLTIDANTLRTVTPPSSTTESSINTVMEKEPLSDTSVRNTGVPNSAEASVLSNGLCILKDLKSKLSCKDDKQDSKNTNDPEKINNIDSQESTAKEIVTLVNSLVSKSSMNTIPNSEEDTFITNNDCNEDFINLSSEEESVGKPPRKKAKLINHEGSPSLREDESLLLKAIQRQNDILEGMAKTLTRIEKSLEERSAEEAQKKNSMLVKISDNLEQLGESLRTVSKSLKLIGEQ